MSAIDTDAMFDKALGLAERVEKLELLALKFAKLARDKELELLSNGFLPDADAETRMRAASLRVNQMIEEEHGDEFRWFDEEKANIAGLRVSHEAIVATGWADNFANAYWRRFKDIEGDDDPKGEIEA